MGESLLRPGKQRMQWCLLDWILIFLKKALGADGCVGADQNCMVAFPRRQEVKFQPETHGSPEET
jgi:hypothetical protein